MIMYVLAYKHDSDATSRYGYSTSIERFETDPVSLSFNDLLDNIMDAVNVYCQYKIERFKIKIIILLNSEAPKHDVPHRHIDKLSKCKCSTTHDIFKYFSSYIRREKPAVLRIIVEASGCRKAKDLYDNYLNEK